MAGVVGLCELCECTCSGAFGRHSRMGKKVFAYPIPTARCWSHDREPRPLASPKPTLSPYWQKYYAR